MKLKKFRERNYKNISIVGFAIACILLIVGVFFYRSFAVFEEKKNFNVIRGTIEDPGDLYFAYYVDDVITFEMPTKESGYTLSSKSNCTNGVTITWDKEKWGGFVDYTNYQKEVNSRTKCTLYFEKEENNTSSGGSGVDFITNLANTSEELVYDGTADNNLRYIGANPNNYVYFNCEDNNNPTAETCELWRVIGVMNNIDDGTGNKESRIKLIRNESIGEYSWDTSISTINAGRGINEWSEADLMKLLNPGFEENKDLNRENSESTINNSLYWNRQNGFCYYGQSNTTTSCDFTTTGLTDESKKLIGEAVWHTGSNGSEASYDNILTSKFYELERSSNGKICTSGSDCNDSVERTTNWTGHIALLYPSDYGFATSGGNLTNRIKCIDTVLYKWSDSSISYCKSNNWLYQINSFRWFLTPCSNYGDNSFFMNNPGLVGWRSTYEPFNIFPTLYLKSNVKILDNGSDGSETNPFHLSLEE